MELTPEDKTPTESKEKPKEESISNNNNDEVYEQKKYDDYLKERDSLLDARRESIRLFDRSIITLAAGSFGLSLTFIRQIVPPEQIIPETMFMLKWAWAGFGISLLSTLISFLVSHEAYTRQIDILELEFFEKKTKVKNNLSIFTNYLNWLSIGAFIIGAFYLASFSISNLSP